MKRILSVLCLCTLVTLIGCMHASAQKEKGITFFSEGQLGWGFTLNDEGVSYLGAQAQIIGYRFNPKANIGIGYGIHAYDPLFQANSAYNQKDNGDALGLSIGYDYQAMGENNISHNNSAFTLKFTCFY